jgi:GNAT superfamily N-acetyltransferase
MSLLFSDLSLSQRLERAEAQSNIEFVEARALAFPDSRAQWLEVAGAHAMFDGPDSPLTQTFGLGMREPLTEAGLDRLEGFFTGLGAPVFHEVSPLADASVLPLLNRRDYEPFEFTSVMFQTLDGAFSAQGPRSTGVRGRLVEADEVESWALAAGGLTIHEGVALLAGASTVPEGRRRGAQSALLEARLRFAAQKGCDVAMMCAHPGSASQRNAERQGFRIAYTRVKWRRKRDAVPPGS